MPFEEEPSLDHSQRRFAFLRPYSSLAEVLNDHELASLGDSYANFIFSIVLSNKKGKASGAKVKGSVLANALRKAGLRKHLPSRMTKHMLADAAEALMIYGWLRNCTSIMESVATIQKAEDSVEGFSLLLAAIKNRVTFP